MTPNPKPNKKQKKSTSIPIPIVKKVFDRDKNICQYCHITTAGLDHDSLLPAAHCHHIIKRRKITGHQEKYLNTCCWECHQNHGKISLVDKRWLNGENVYASMRIRNH